MITHTVRFADSAALDMCYSVHDTDKTTEGAFQVCAVCSVSS